MKVGLVGPRGQGQSSLASRYVRALAPALTALLLACDSSASKADNSVRRMDGIVSADCTLLPDTAVTRRQAQFDRNDLPFTQIVLSQSCPTISIAFNGAPYVERTYKVVVPADRMLIARAHGDSASVTIAFDFPTEPKPDRSNVARLVMDSLKVDQSREVSVRVRLVPKLREEPPSSRVFLTVLARP